MGATHSLLVTFGVTPEAAAQAQDERIVFYASVTETSRVRGELTSTTTLQIHSMNVDGSDVRQITSGDEHAYFPRWSPERDYILFYRGDVAYEEGLYVMESEGGRAFRVAEEYPRGADWSADGTMIYYVGVDQSGGDRSRALPLNSSQRPLVKPAGGFPIGALNTPVQCSGRLHQCGRSATGQYDHWRPGGPTDRRRAGDPGPPGLRDLRSPRFLRPRAASDKLGHSRACFP